MNETDRSYHPTANIFPLMHGEEYEQLKADIAENGLLVPIILHPDGSILDGRNRHRACLELGIEPDFTTWEDDGMPMAYVVTLNLRRRHLTSSQRAAIAVDILPRLEEKAKLRQKASRFGGATICTTVKGKTRSHAAKKFNTNHQYVNDAKALKEKAPEIFEQVLKGDKTIPQANREFRKQQRKEAPPMPTNKYRVLYADPPWKYNDAGVIGETDNYGRAERHYPVMSIEELCEIGDDIKKITEPNAVLFLWTTSPMMMEAIEKIVPAWGFTYKTCFVWDKVLHNFGHYNSVRHELLLICTRGRCTPDSKKLHDSVVSIKRSKKHSEKPAYFRELIDKMYPQGKRLELFAREVVPNWETWGNEPGIQSV